MSLRTVSRRGLLTGGVAAAVLSATGLPAFAQARGGTLRLGLTGADISDDWDGRRHHGAFMRVLGHGAVFDCLTEIAATGELVGELAQSWESSKGAQVWTFDLRRDVIFHDGTPFTAADVIASLALHQENSPIRAIARSIVSMEQLGRHQIRLTLREGNADFPFLMADPHFIIYPHENIAQAMAQGIGTGLYRVDAFLPGARAMLSRVQSHYKDGRAGWFDAIDATAIGQDAARTQALIGGAVDAIDTVGAADLGALAAAGTARALITKGNRHLCLSLPAGTDPRIRAALQHGIDRQSLRDGLLGGLGSIAADHPIGPANASLATDLAAPAHDPDRARALLAAAGFDGLGLDFGMEDFPFDPASGLRRGGDLAVQARFHAGRITEDWALSLDAAAETDGRFAALLRTARSELDSDVRAAHYRQLQAISQAQGAAIIPVYTDTIDGHSRRLAHGPAVGALWGLDSHRIAERWWFA